MKVGLRTRVALLSLVLLIPCFWQRRIEAGDLGSHIYNAWLAPQVELGRMPGLSIAPVTTNVLFDLLLGRLSRAFGPEPAQRIAVSLAVLVFFWGAFQLISAMSGNRPWFLTPCLMMLAYGWVFHMGFFNFYLATGLAFWALALQLDHDRPRLGSIALLIVAYTGHVLPAIWALAVLAYIWIARKLSSRSKLILLGAAICAIVGLNFWLTRRYTTFSSFQQVLEAAAVDQVWVFGLKYYAISIALALLWGFLLLGATHGSGVRTIHDTAFQICILMGLGVLILPTRIESPMYGTAVSFVTERMTLPYGVMICAFLARASPPKWLRISFVPLALVYFSFLYADVRAFNKVEGLDGEAHQQAFDRRSRIYLHGRPHEPRSFWDHILDRVCVGRCLSYANYEPFSKMFRVRVDRPNPYAVASAADLATLKGGGYVVKPIDVPIYQIDLCDEARLELCLKPLQVGEVTKASHLSVAPLLW